MWTELGGYQPTLLLASATQFKDYLGGGQRGYCQDLRILQHYLRRRHLTHMID